MIGAEGVVERCKTCASLADENEMVVARLAARMNCKFVCNECGREAQHRQSAAATTEERFWQIVDQNGLSGLPSDMWDALDRLVRRDAEAQTRIAQLETALAGAREEIVEQAYAAANYRADIMLIQQCLEYGQEQEAIARCKASVAGEAYFDPDMETGCADDRSPLGDAIHNLKEPPHADR